MKTEIVTDLKREATRMLAEARRTREPILITEHGRPSAYLVDAESYERLQQRVALLEGIARGERALFEGRAATHAEAQQRMKKWLDGSAPTRRSPISKQTPNTSPWKIRPQPDASCVACSSRSLG